MPNTNFPDAALIRHKTWLLGQITDTASWCQQVASLFPNDTRSIRCCDTLRGVADVVQALPVRHKLFSKLEQIDRADPLTRGRWLDEVHLEFSSIGYLYDDSAPHIIQRLIEITDASLAEARQFANLH